jgi:hypothetical protein
MFLIDALVSEHFQLHLYISILITFELAASTCPAKDWKPFFSILQLVIIYSTLFLDPEIIACFIV